MDQTDNALMLGARDGELEGFAVLFERHHLKLWEFFYRMTGNRSESDDLVQDVFLRMLKYRSGFHAESQFRAWMYQIARNARADRVRKRPAETALGSESNGIAGSGPFPDRPDTPDRLVEREQRFALLRRALLALPEEKREVLVLARYQEMKYDEIGDLLKLDAGAVKSRVHRAMNDLREIFLKLSGEKLKCDVKKSENVLRII